MSEKLSNFLGTMKKRRGVYRKGEYWFALQDDVPAHDFNKEILHPNKKYPDGLLGIRCDCDFWVCAVLPYDFRHHRIETLVKNLWPAIENPEYGKTVYAR